jgi:hypothetical protein
MVIVDYIHLSIVIVHLNVTEVKHESHVVSLHVKARYPRLRIAC